MLQIPFSLSETSANSTCWLRKPYSLASQCSQAMQQFLTHEGSSGPHANCSDGPGPESPATAFRFISSKPYVGEPSCQLNDFKEPKLGRFPHPPTSLRWRRFLGAGEDGLFLSARTSEGSSVPVKCVSGSVNPSPLASMALFRLKTSCA